MLEERRLRRVSIDHASWFETAQERLLTTRGRHGSRGIRVKKKARMKRAFELAAGQLTRQRSDGLVVDLGEVVLGRLRTVGDEFAEIFGGGLRPRDEGFTART